MDDARAAMPEARGQEAHRGAEGSVEKSQMQSFLRENIYFENKHLFLCFCVHDASPLVENGPKVERHVSSCVSPTLWEAAEWPRLLSAGTTVGTPGK